MAGEEWTNGHSGPAVQEHPQPAAQTQTQVKVLVVDDEPEMLSMLREFLEIEGYDVAEAYDAQAAMESIKAEQPDIIILDVLLPGLLDGFEVCRRLRQFSDAYVLMLSARAEEIDKIVGLSVGADDFMAKPFSPRELVARVKAMLRRPRTQMAVAAQALDARARQREEPLQLPAIAFGDITIDMSSHEVAKRGRHIHLTPREFNLLVIMAEHPGRVFTRSYLLERIWGDDYYDDHVVDVHVGHLRRKIEDEPDFPCYIETVRGIGYRFGPHGE